MKDGSLVIESPYNPDFVDDLKKIPWQYRKWDGSYWIVMGPYTDKAHDLCEKHFDKVEEEFE
jgi:hypothetical protein